MIINTKYRSEQLEIMDDFAMEGPILEEALNKIASINQLLGGNKLTVSGVQKLIQKIPKEIEITIVDVGCGNGDMLRKLADYGVQNNKKFQLIGIDANNFTINHARKLSCHYPNIQYKLMNVFEQVFTELKYDIILSTLTLHHFKNYEIEKLIAVFYSNANIGMVINDLQRSSISYRLFQMLGFVFQLNSMSKKDGLISILRGFKKKELIQFSRQLKTVNYSIKWKWAFRYQWIIQK